MCMQLMFFITAVIAWLAGIQVGHRDFVLLSGRYRYRMGLAQVVSYCALVAVVSMSCVWTTGLWATVLLSAAGVVVSFLTEFALSRLNAHALWVTLAGRLLAVAAMAAAMVACGTPTVLPCALMGWYVRNSALGVVHRNPFVLACRLRREGPSADGVATTECEIPASMPDFSHAGCHREATQATLVIDVTRHGVVPDTGEDMLDALQALIDKVGQDGGGTLYFPRGEYLFNCRGQKRFLQVNHSHVTLEGELDAAGRPLARMVNCGSLERGHAQPWLSPFFITTGEKIQPSNQFWGLQFGNWRRKEMKSDSMSDPGSDGSLLTPPPVTVVTAPSRQGEDVLHVADSACVGRYILLGLYNADEEASLLKDILGQPQLRPEWEAAMRAGAERAPSFQWLVQVKRIVDAHTIQLTQPLWRDCDLTNSPVICNVDMLEDITIRNLKLSSRWNGLFRHHGHRHYYTVRQAQEMDYGWNGINLKRVAHALVENVVIENFTNPLCVTDSRNATCSHIEIKGYDGHQGIKVYCHSCDNLFSDIRFYSHFADMMGGEGNAYGNVFSRIHYLNPCFKPVEYDFHGFAEAPFSPPCYNLFELVYGFAAIHSSGPLHMQPACGRGNVWWNCFQEGEQKGGNLFHQGHYRLRFSLRNRLAMLLRGGSAAQLLPAAHYARFYTDFHFHGIHTVSDVSLSREPGIHSSHWNETCSIHSLYEAQQAEAKKEPR